MERRRQYLWQVAVRGDEIGARPRERTDASTHADNDLRGTLWSGHSLRVGRGPVGAGVYDTFEAAAGAAAS